MPYNTVTLVEYNATWPHLFQQEAKKLAEILGTECSATHHIGSTAIVNMPSKSVVDILVECADFSKIDWIKNQLQHLGYSDFRRSMIPYYSFFARRQDEKVRYHLHLFTQGDPQVKRHVNFCEYLTAHPAEAKAYRELKNYLAAQYQNDIIQYVCGKSKLVQEIDSKAKRWKSNTLFLPFKTGSAAALWTPAQIYQAMEANLNVHMTHFAQYIPSVELVRVPGYTIVNAGLSDDTFNYVTDADFSDAEAPDRIAEVSSHFKTRQIPFSWWVAPQTQPIALSQHLVEHGYQLVESNVAMYLDLDQWRPTDILHPELKIIRAQDEKTLVDFALVLANDKACFKAYFSQLSKVLTTDDPVEYYVGYANGQPVVRGLSCYYAGVAGLHWLSTVPEARKRGYGAAMQKFRLKRAKDLGFHFAVLQASHEGYPLYKKLGYRECGVYQEYKVLLHK